MRLKLKNHAVRLLALSMAATMATGVALSFRKEAEGAVSDAAFASSIRDVTGEYDLSSLREKYFDRNTVLNNMYSPDDERWVIVEFGEGSVAEQYLETAVGAGSFSSYAGTGAARRKAESLEASHQAFLNQLRSKGIEYECKYSYTGLLNGVAIKVRRGDVAEIRGMAGVKSVTFSESYAAPKAAVSNDAHVYTTGIYDSEDLAEEGIAGQGMVVAILDTGLDFSHKAFQNKPKETTLTKDKVEQAISGGDLELLKKRPSTTADEVYYNSKVPFAFDYADDDPDVFPSYNSHGTHVAGIVAGKDDSRIVNPDTGETFVGVAPEAQLAIFKVFTDDPDSRMLGGADTVDILAALNDCANLGVDVINMSLGTSAGFSLEDGEGQSETVRNTYDRIEQLGISLVCAASNDYSSGYGGGNGTNLATNPDSGTVGSPSTYSAALSVASINGQQSRYMQVSGRENDVAFITNSSDVNGNELDFTKQLFEKFSSSVDADGKLRLNYVVIGGLGEPSDFSSSVVRNALSDGRTIALIKRGTTTFQDKVTNAMNAGAAACIIYNNLSGVIRMSLGDLNNPVPTCSITMEEGQMLVNAATGRVGTLEFSQEFLAGPFMSDFSSWGPTPDLKLKPEITAHGGEITSAIAGQDDYDEYSGTSMASPNMAGAVALLRQYVKNHPEKYGYEAGYFTTGVTNGKNKELSALVYQLLMSTATIAHNEVGNPYSPRKQGAGLADITHAVDTEAYLTVKGSDGLEGEVSDRTKIELGDDPAREGVWDMAYTVHNVSDHRMTFTPNAYVMTETLAIDMKTVAERAYMLTDSEVTYTVNDNRVSTVTVGSKQTVDVKVHIELGPEGRAYLDRVNPADGKKYFENGMYVEGFLTLTPVNESDKQCSLTVPYLAFYGDWTAAPLFDYDTYEIAEDQADTSIEEDEKRVASAAETRALGLYYEDQYIIPLGSYIYEMSPFDTEIYPSREKAAISMWDAPSAHSIYQLYMIYAGLLRGAKMLDITIRDTVTGELMFSRKDYNQNKSYAGGGSNHGSSVMLEIDPLQWNLSNNRTYAFEMKGTLDYKGGSSQEPARNSFAFDFTVDTEDPQIESYQIRFDPYVDGRETNYRIYLDLDVSDNQYVMDVMPCHLYYDRSAWTGTMAEGEPNTLGLITEYPVPVYGQRGEKTRVTIEITDYFEELVEQGNMYVSVEDYAMNQTLYEISLSGQNEYRNYPDAIQLATDDKLTLAGYTSTEGGTIEEYNLTLAPNESYKVNVASAFKGGVADLATFGSLQWETDDITVARAKDREIFGAGIGTCDIRLFSYGEDSSGRYLVPQTKAVIHVTVGGEAAAAPRPSGILLESVFDEDNKFVDLNQGYLNLHPAQEITIVPSLDPWYCPETTFTFEERNPRGIVELDKDTGKLVAKKRGSTLITVRSPDYPFLTKSLTVTVGYNYEITSYTLYEWYGTEDRDGEKVIEIPENLNVMYLNEECFRNNTEVTKIILPSTLTEIPEGAFRGCTNLKEIYIPGACVYIRNGAFVGCTNLTTIDLGEYVNKKHKDEVDEDGNPLWGGAGTLTVGRDCFNGCVNLTTIKHADRLTTAYERAFAGCTSLQSIDITGLRICYPNVFQGCQNLKDITTGEYTRFGDRMFKGCISLQTIEIKSDRLGSEVFADCSRLSTVTFNIADGSSFNAIGSGAFRNCTALQNITLPNGSYRVGAEAFQGCTNLKTVTLSATTLLSREGANIFKGCDNFAAFAIDGTSSNYTVSDGVLLSEEGKCVELVPTGKTTFTLDTSVTKIGAAAFAGSKITSLDLAHIESVGKYAFSGSMLENAKFSVLTSLEEGAFYGCDSLMTATGFKNVNEIPAYAFYGCNQLTGVDFGVVNRIGAYAFTNSGITSMPESGNLTSIGAHAFENTKLTNVALSPNENCTVGDYAFAGNRSLRSVTLTKIGTLGTAAFANCTSLDTVTFNDGCENIGDFAFVQYSTNSVAITAVNENKVLKNVTLSSSVKTIGNYAFANATALTTIGDTSGVTTIGDYAFSGSGINNFNFNNVQTIGTAAFEGCSALTSAFLSNATVIGPYAFYESGLIQAEFGKAERIGAFAFAKTKLTQVEIPATLEYSYEDVWQKIDDAGNLVDVKGKRSLAFGAGAFAGIGTLKEFTVTGSDVYTVKGGVLFAKVGNGLELVQFPAGKATSSYEIPDGTVRIADCAFYGARTVKRVTFPYTVASIGSYAFFDCAANQYIFKGVEAPVLEAAFDQEVYDAFYYNNYNGSQIYEGEGGMIETFFYANFDMQYWVREIKGTYYGSPMDLSFTSPENGKGYDGYVWRVYFNSSPKSEYAMERGTHMAQDLINVIPTASEIGRMTSAEEVRSASKDYVQPARKQFNTVLDPRQIALLAAEQQQLLDTERAIRDKLAELGSPVAIASLQMANWPDKIRYTAGESFDRTGMVIKVIYEDSSEIVITDYTVDKDVLSVGDEFITVSYGGKTLEIPVNVVAPDPSAEQPSEETPSEEEGKKGCGGCGSEMKPVACMLAVLSAAAATGIALFVKRRRSK